MRAAFVQSSGHDSNAGSQIAIWLSSLTFALSPEQQKYAAILREEIEELVDSGFSLSLNLQSPEKAKLRPGIVSVQIPQNLDDIAHPIVLLDESLTQKEVKTKKPVTDRPTLLRRQPVTSYKPSSHTDPVKLVKEVHDWYNAPRKHVEITSL